jgi:phospholipid/cholesterol/gamma-HCH transport system substrate-binding protein
VLSEQTLTNVTVALTNFRVLSDRAVAVVDRVNRLVDTNSPPISISMSNLVKFSEELDKLALEMTLTVATNRIELTKGVKNLERTGAALERLVDDVEAGKGLAGTLMKDQELKFNISNVASNLAILSSNLNKYGLLYKPRQPKTSEAPRSAFPGRTPFK